MLQVTDTGVQVTLTGTPASDYTFAIACVLMVCAVLVAVAITVFSSEYAIGSLFVLACGCFAFNVYRIRKKRSTPHIASGVVQILAFSVNHQGRTTQFLPTLSISDSDGQLVLSDEQKSLILSGFDNAQERQIVKNVLLGASINKKLANIKLQD